MYQVKIISSTVREGRRGPAIAEWIASKASMSDSFHVEVIDLGVLNLPMNTEPHHPKLKQYEHEHTKQWSRTIEEADAFIIVTTEYNHSFPAPLKNALDYLVKEWAYKPVGFVSYAGVSAGTRATNALKDVVTTLKMIPLLEAVHIPFFMDYMNAETGRFEPNDISENAAVLMLAELASWAKGMKYMRQDRMADALK